jgi:hypothetical protein
VSAVPSDFYARWRSSAVGADTLREASKGAPPSERLLQQVWFHQRLLREQLLTGDGRRVRVLHPGFWNREGGPDFRQAVVQFGEDSPRSGDIEVDLAPANWRAHAHDRNPAFEGVILHVVWDGEVRDNQAPPVLALKTRLDAPLEELNLWSGSEAVQVLPDSQTGQCHGPLGGLAPGLVVELLQQAAQARLQAKAHQLQARARQVGCEQALWEGLFRALGYKRNVWPMQRVAELLPEVLARELPGDTPLLVLQSRLLGVSGLLPTELSQQTAGRAAPYFRRIWDHWWRERDAFSDFILPRMVWRFNGLRPANQPQRRLALAAHWLAAGGLSAGLENWLRNSVADRCLPASLLELLQPEPDPFWSWHWGLGSPRLAKPQPLLGEKRVTDLAMNVVLPWFWMRAAAGQNVALQRQVEQRYFAWPIGEDNAVLRLTRQRLFGGAAPRLPRTAALQQGLLQVVRDFCDHVDALCNQCRFPELVQQVRG